MKFQREFFFFFSRAMRQSHVFDYISARERKSSPVNHDLIRTTTLVFLFHPESTPHFRPMIIESFIEIPETSSQEDLEHKWRHITLVTNTCWLNLEISNKKWAYITRNYFESIYFLSRRATFLLQKLWDRYWDRKHLSWRATEWQITRQHTHDTDLRGTSSTSNLQSSSPLALLFLASLEVLRVRLVNGIPRAPKL